MAEYKNFIRRDLENGYVMCEDVHLPSGCVCSVFFSPKSIYVLSCGPSSPEKRYREIQDLLGAVRLRLYLLAFSQDDKAGLYDPQTNTFGCEMDNETLSQDIDFWLDSGRVIFAKSAIDRMVSRLKSADIQARGYAVQENGEIFLIRNGTVKKASSVSSDLQYYLTLFGGTLGFHRFALGKYMSGVIYLVTGGLFMAGWLLDLVQLFIGIQKDSKKQYLLPLTNRKFKFLVLPLGLVTGFMLFQTYLKVSELSGLGLQNLVTQQVNNTNPYALERFLNTLLELIPQ